MTTRTMFLKGIAASVVGLLLPKKKKVQVSVLEHLPETDYVNRWEFDTTKEAEEFVRGLIPHVQALSVEGRQTEIRTGYRDALRYRGQEYVCWLQHKGTGFVVARKHSGLHFYNVADAWAYLENIRIDGKIVTRPTVNRHTGKAGLNEYLTQPIVMVKS
jgi:hypothetical protein